MGIPEGPEVTNRAAGLFHEDGILACRAFSQFTPLARPDSQALPLLGKLLIIPPMGLVSYVLTKLRDRERRLLDRNRAEADAMLDRDEAAGEKILLSDKDFADLKRMYDSYGPDREKDRDRIRRIARLSGRKL